MSNRESTNNASRRAFLRGSVGLGAGTAAVVLTAGTAAAAAVSNDTAITAEKAPGQKGYELTQHVADYYKTAAL